VRSSHNPIGTSQPSRDDPVRVHPSNRPRCVLCIGRATAGPVFARKAHCRRRWSRALVPRLPRFRFLFPHVNLHIKTGQSLANFKSDGVDIAIRFGTGDWKGLRAIKLLDEELFPVCSPSLNDGRLPKDPASMSSEPLLIDRNVSWRAWFRSAGVTLDRDIAGTSFTDTNALMEAAVAGHGIALGRLSFTRSDILAGKLVRLSEHSLRLSHCHYAVYPIASESNPALVAFRDWLIEETRRT
jgi:LysR family transcriptional regulator, glycine cleavage system transcriptional activator